MTPVHYKTHTTSRGFTYAYYRSPFVAQGSKPTLIFLHGFPSSAHSWHYQISFFEALGYDVIAPDMLGYGGTDKPTDAALYGGNGLARDIVDILDKENVGVEGKRAIAVGHDWYVLYLPFDNACHVLMGLCGVMWRGQGLPGCFSSGESLPRPFRRLRIPCLRISPTYAGDDFRGGQQENYSRVREGHYRIHVLALGGRNGEGYREKRTFFRRHSCQRVSLSTCRHKRHCVDLESSLIPSLAWPSRSKPSTGSTIWRLGEPCRNG